MINRILLIDVDVFYDNKYSDSLFHTHHPIGLLYLVSAAKEAFPDISFRVFHTSTSAEPLLYAEQLISSFKPDIIGIRALSTAKEAFTLMVEKIRLIDKSIIIIGGGPYVSASYSDILKSGLIDIAVIGEGEETFKEIIGHFNTHKLKPIHIKGTALINEGILIENQARTLIQNIEQLPFPDYTYINLNDYKGIKNHALQDASQCAFILTSRGCPYNCFYCHQKFGRKIRRRSAENVIAEMREHIEKRNIYDFVFLDDMFNLPTVQAKTLLKLISKELPRVSLNFPNGLRADHIDLEMLDLFEAAGTVEMALAIESVTPRIQKIIGKNLNITKAEKIIEEASKRFVTRVFYMIGFPTETYDEALNTIKFAAQHEHVANPSLNVLRIYNNTKLLKYLNPNAIQLEAITSQEKKEIHMELFGDIDFYGDAFPENIVPLKSNDMKELLYIWLRDVLTNKSRIRKSHNIVNKFYEGDKLFNFYKGIFNKTTFTQKDLDRLLS